MRVRSGIRLRAIAVAAATLGAVTVAGFALPATATAQPGHAAPAQAPAGKAWAPASSAAIHPGVQTVTDGGGSCTSNFVFTSGGRVFLGQAAHCAGTGQATETNGCDSGTMPLGTTVKVEGASRPATMVYSSWVTMQHDGETDPDTCAHNDFALVELDAADTAKVNPSVPFFGGPTGINVDGLPAGAEVYSYGNSPLRQGISALSPKAGVSAGDVAGGWGHEVYTVSPGVPGDSGSAYMDGSGRAVGLLSTLNLAPLPVSNGLADMSRVLAYANAHGGIGYIELALGTEPFTKLPPGVPPAQVAPPAGPPLGA
ncbi:serine protease [Pseudonocardia acidicola]|uniref:Serine protease n=1 Tax=Pseudonocardia acidicola TaxID=2724939 RepID=A0ABX1SFT5_9PSEU|nr:serine protease [Pseudonocardia acidicola]NMH99241.1 serine protease [Pseudonocardia acidicola]